MRITAMAARASAASRPRHSRFGENARQRPLPLRRATEYQAGDPSIEPIARSDCCMTSRRGAISTTPMPQASRAARSSPYRPAWPSPWSAVIHRLYSPRSWARAMMAARLFRTLSVRSSFRFRCRLMILPDTAIASHIFHYHADGDIGRPNQQCEAAIDVIMPPINDDEAVS